MSSGIRHLERREINNAKWDWCITNATNSLIYAQSWYLDAACNQWSALVQGDYEAVMPLPWRRKWGIRYVYQPYFMQRLGLFSTKIFETIPEAFAAALCGQFSFIHFEATQPFAWPQAMQQKRTNLVIDLQQPYTSIAASFLQEAHKNIRKATARGCALMRDVPVPTVIKLYRAAYGAVQPKIENAAYQRLEALALEAIKREHAFTIGVKDPESNLVYAALMLMDNHRIYYLLGAPTEKGRKMRATYFVIDSLLRQFAGTSLVFDFEGSEIPDVAQFYRKFGPQEESYYTIQISQLPGWVNWLKSLRG